MVVYLEKKRSHLVYRCFSIILLLAFVLSMSVFPTHSFAQMAGLPELLPAPGTMVLMTPAYMPAIIKGITIDPVNPLHFSFIIDTGDSKLQGEELAQESRKLIKYFLATLTTPEKDLWVNLSPYEKDRIIPNAFGVTEMGRDLLAQDYILKQLTASLMYPEKELGQTFWDKVYEKAQSLYGETDIPVDTFNKVWIVPQTATLYEQDNSVFVVESHLKVMLEEDYIALQESQGENGSFDAVKGYDKADSKVASEVIREVIIPEIEKEVNTGTTFAKLRQIYNSMILATWYKTNLRESLLGQVYVDQNKVAGIDLEDKTEKEQIYNQYLEAFKTGVYNYMKDEYDPETQEIIPRKYFSGGMKFAGELRTVVRSLKAAGMSSAQRRDVYDRIAPVVRQTGQLPTIVEVEAMLQDFGPEAVETVKTYLENVQRSGTTGETDMTRADRSMQASSVISEQAKRQLTPSFVERLKNMNLANSQIKALNLAISADQSSVLNQLAELPDELIRSNLDELYVSNVNDTEGLVGYRNRGYRISTQGSKGLQDVARIEEPRKINMVEGDTEYREAYDLGAKNVNKIVTALVAGGLGERLSDEDFKYTGLKLDLPIDPVAGSSYINYFVRNILNWQNRSNAINSQAEKIPLFMMTSQDNHDRTIEMMTANNYFGMDGVTVIDMENDYVVFDKQDNKVKVVDRESYLQDGSIINARDLKQIVIARQESVLVMDTQGNFVLKNGMFAKKPHNHGDIHILMHNSGLAKAFADAGKIQTLFFQDTNGEIPNAVLPGLGVSIKNNLKGNYLAVDRKPGENVGVLAKLRMKDGTSQVGNVEYNEVKILADSLGIPESEFDTGNTNVFFVEQNTYTDVLEKTKGLPGEEIANVKNGEFRLELPMQDVTKALDGETVGLTRFDRRSIFVTTKNSIKRSIVSESKNIATEHYGAAVGARFEGVRKLLNNAGVNVNVPGSQDLLYEGNYEVQTWENKRENKKQELIKGIDAFDEAALMNTGWQLTRSIPVSGIQFNRGAVVSLPLSLVNNVTDAKQVFQGNNTITNNAGLLVQINEKGDVPPGSEHNVVFKGVVIDGSLAVYLNPDQSIEFEEGFTVKNSGVNWNKLSYSEISNAEISEADRLRGYQINFSDDTLTYDLRDMPAGKYIVTSTGELKPLSIETTATTVSTTQETTSRNVGGIDLNPALLDMQIKRDGNGVPLPLPQQPIQNMQINGFLPVIINITPITSLPLQFGMADSDTSSDIARYSSPDMWMDDLRDTQ